MEITWKNYAIRAEEDQFILYRNVVRKTKEGKDKDDVETLGYFSQLEHCLQKILRIEVSKRRDVVPLKEYISMWKETALQMKNDLRNEIVLTRY